MSIKLPPPLNPFKNIGDFDLCWCGSNKVHVACHKNRSSDRRIGLGEGLSTVTKGFKKTIGCLHPDAGVSCNGKIISSHTIQKSGPLKSISKDGQVYSTRDAVIDIEKNNGKFIPKKRGVSDVSVFPGFCSKHDNDFFLPVENGSFEINPENAFLFYYRNICSELHAKQRLISDDVFSSKMDGGSDIVGQFMVQQYLIDSRFGAAIAVEEISSKRDELITIFRNNTYDKINSIYVEYEELLPFVCSFVCSPTLDISGRKLQSLDDEYLKTVSVSSVNFDGRSGFIFSSMDVDLIEMINSHVERLKEKSANQILKWFFFNAENIALNVDWWESLDNVKKLYLQSLSDCGTGMLSDRDEMLLLRKNIRILTRCEIRQIISL